MDIPTFYKMHSIGHFVKIEYCWVSFLWDMNSTFFHTYKVYMIKLNTIFFFNFLHSTRFVSWFCAVWSALFIHYFIFLFFLYLVHQNLHITCVHLHLLCCLCVIVNRIKSIKQQMKIKIILVVCFFCGFWIRVIMRDCSSLYQW